MAKHCIKVILVSDLNNKTTQKEIGMLLNEVVVIATMLVCSESATLNRKRPHGQARLQKAMELEECLRSVVPLALRQTKLAFISTAPYGPMFSLLFHQTCTCSEAQKMCILRET